eukprot:3410852-Pyramimonas_sp.AAC.2
MARLATVTLKQSETHALALFCLTAAVSRMSRSWVGFRHVFPRTPRVRIIKILTFTSPSVPTLW